MLPASGRQTSRGHDLFRLRAVLLKAKGEQVSEEEVHGAWSAWMQTIDSSHDALVPCAGPQPGDARRGRAVRRGHPRGGSPSDPLPWLTVAGGGLRPERRPSAGTLSEAPHSMHRETGNGSPADPRQFRAA
ncbi:DUF7701 domain-containing protein [Streptomyces nodosus]|uniref:DUF7701 domain-containing protein n=1 Tax=Streptomyces nodosus TaxID=40318 RepID=UPI003F516821